MYIYCNIPTSETIKSNSYFVFGRFQVGISVPKFDFLSLLWFLSVPPNNAQIEGLSQKGHGRFRPYPYQFNIHT